MEEKDEGEGFGQERDMSWMLFSSFFFVPGLLAHLRLISTAILIAVSYAYVWSEVTQELLVQLFYNHKYLQRYLHKPIYIHIKVHTLYFQCVRVYQKMGVCVKWVC